MLSKNINFKNFKTRKFNQRIKNDLNSILKQNNAVIESLGADYKNSYNKKVVTKSKRYSHVRVIGMGGSILGTKAINDVLEKKIKKNF